MSPYQRIRQAYLDRPEAHPFEFYVEQHLHRGFVFSTPTYFVMGLPVNRDAVLAGLHVLDPQPDPTAWYVSAFAGDMRRAWECLPYPLPWLGFHRDRHGGKDLCFYPAGSIQRLSRLFGSLNT